MTLPPPNNTTHTPLLENGRDPWIVYHEGFFYYCQVDYANEAVFVRRSPDLAGITAAQPVEVWRPQKGHEYSEEIWAPELHWIEGSWYIYVAASDGQSHNHRMFVLNGSTADPQQPLTLKGKMASSDDQWAIDGTVLEHGGKRYCVWSGWDKATGMEQGIYIAPMSNPWTISGPRVCLSRPEHAWEHAEAHGVNEGPQVVVARGFVHVIFSANGAWTDDYCLGQLTLTGDNPLDPTQWQKHPCPIFAKDDKDIFGPGHAGFVLDEGLGYGWMLFHAAQRQGAGWERHVLMKPFRWNQQGILTIA